MALALATCFVLQSEPKLLNQKPLSKYLLHAWHHASLWEPKKYNPFLSRCFQFMGVPVYSVSGWRFGCGMWEEQWLK